MHIPPKKAEESERNLRELPDISHIRRWKWQRPPPPLRIRIHAPSKLDRRSDSLIDRFASHEWNTIYITEKKSQSWKRCPYLFFLIFLFGMLKQHERAVSFVKQCERRWNNDSFDVLSRMVATRRSEKATCECREAPDARRHGVTWRRWSWRREDGRRVWGAWISKPMAHRRQKMQNDGKIWCKRWQFINHLIPTSPLVLTCSVANAALRFFACQAPARELRW